METEQPLLTKEEFIAKFKNLHKLACSNPETMLSWASYTSEIRKIRRECVRYLRKIGASSSIRIEYNNLLQSLAKYGHREYLYYKDPTCKLCGRLITRFEDATIDHIMPLSKGGDNIFENKQITHARCNHKKSNKIIVNTL